MDIELKNRLLELEKYGDFESALELISRGNYAPKDRLDMSLRTLFMILDYLIEGDFNESEQHYYSHKIKSIFDELYSEFHENAEFLAFGGMMVTLAEWYFDKTFDDGIQMIKDAREIDSESICYECLYYVFEDQRLEINSQIKSEKLNHLFAHPSNVEWLQSRGLLGAYVLGIFQNVYDRLREYHDNLLGSLESDTSAKSS